MKGCGKLQKEARRKKFRRKEEELRLDTLVPETSTHLHHHIKKNELNRTKAKKKKKIEPKRHSHLEKSLPLLKAQSDHDSPKPFLG